jgi:transposase
MIRRGFLSEEEEAFLLSLDRRGGLRGLSAKRPNALILLNRGQSCAQVACNLLLDDDTVRSWFKLYEEGGVDGLLSSGHTGRACALDEDQQTQLYEWVEQTLPSGTGAIGQWIEDHFGLTYGSRSGLLALLERLGLSYTRPEEVPRKIDAQEQKRFIAHYESLLNGLFADETVLCADAVHPTHAARRAGFWGPKDAKIVLRQNSGRQRLNIHGVIDLETGKTCMLDVERADAQSTIALLSEVQSRYPDKSRIHVFLDNARYHRARLVQDWLKQPGCRIKLHFIPPYCPHLAPIERLWGVMHKNVTHNRCYDSFKDFRSAILKFLRETIPENWQKYCDSVSDNFRVIDPHNFRFLN